MTIGRMLEELNNEWGLVDLMSVNGLWLCANQTDEMLGGEPRIEFKGKTPEEAVKKAYESIK